MARAKRPAPWLKPVAHILLAVPLVWMLWGWALLILAADDSVLGINPVEHTIRFLGDYAIRILLAALAVTPLTRITKWKPLMRIRRLVGLWAFAYVILHLLTYFGMDRLFSLTALWEDVLKRQYITVGMAALLLMIPLAVTSTNAMVRRLGARRWQKLHRTVYVIGVLAVVHHVMMVKGNQIMPWVHGTILALLLGYRAVDALRRRQRRQQRQQMA